jgi:hypothetical protein
MALPDEGNEPAQLVFGRTVTLTEGVGIWLIPDKTYTDCGIVQFFIPWQVVLTVAVIEEGRRKQFGFSQRKMAV